MTGTVVEATAEHVRAIIPRLRCADVSEVARLGKPVEQAIAYAMERSPYRRAWIIDGEVACIFGVGLTVDDKALPWLWATDLVDRHKVSFIKLYRRTIPEVLALFPVVETAIEDRYRAYLGWLVRQGAIVGRVHSLDGFSRVEMRRADG